MLKHPMFRHILPVILLLLLQLVAGSAFSAGGQRDWWYFQGNDACQGCAAHAAVIRLGAPAGYVVWPGATLPTAYLYWQALIGEMPAQPMTVESTEALLAESVHFHWTQAATYGLILLLLVYALGTRWSGSPVLGFAVAALLACNEWFLWALFHVRPEVPSIVFVLAGCWWADSRRTVAWPLVRPIVFGVLIGLAVLSKIQIVPVIPLAVWLYVRRDRHDGGAVGRQVGVSWRVIAAGLIALGAIAMIRTKAIDGAGYGLPKLPSSFAHMCFGLILATTTGLVALSRPKYPLLERAATQVLLAGAGMTSALLVLLLPVVWFSGASAAWVSANRIVYGTTSFARYGLQLASEGGWGRKGGIVNRVRSFIEFQASSATYGWNLAVWTGLVIVVCALLAAGAIAIRNRGVAHRYGNVSSEASRLTLGVALALYLAAILCDIATTHRTVSNTSYAFYHIFSLPLYLMSLAVSFGAVTVWLRQGSASTAVARIAGVAATVLIGVCAMQLLLETSRFKQWESEKKPAVTYFGDRNSTRVIGSVAPEFWLRTGVTYEALRVHVLQRESTEDSQDARPGK